MSTASSSYSSKEERLGMVMKGKRTKRQRFHHPSAQTASSTASSTGNYTLATEDEEDMANCLILLAQGSNFKPKLDTDKVNAMRVVIGDPTPVSGGGFCMYECKTCFKRFPSFQALGGHRTSHKKPKLVPLVPTTTVSEVNNKLINNKDGNLQRGISSITKSTVVGSNNSKHRIHECSICGAAFSSGQALGGHMRRHRPVVIPTATTTTPMIITTGSILLQDMKKERNHLPLDLNLPAPSDDDHGGNPTKSPSESSTTTSTFGGDDPSALLFTALVNCHF